MTADIGPGDWVECVDAQEHFNRGLLPIPPLVLGAVYMVTSCGIHDVTKDPTVCLLGLPQHNEIYRVHGIKARFFGYYVGRFRPFRGPTLACQILRRGSWQKLRR